MKKNIKGNGEQDKNKLSSNHGCEIYAMKLKLEQDLELLEVS